MQVIKCEICGSNELTKENGYFVCQYCKTKYTLEEAKKLIIGGTVQTKEVDFNIRGGVLEKYSGESDEVVIPNNVKEIGFEAFKGLAVTKVVIPDSVKIIGHRAFSECKFLKSITIPDSVTSIGEKAFSYCSSIESVTIPDSVTSIGWNAFSNCDSLKSATIFSNFNASFASVFEYDKIEKAEIKSSDAGTEIRNSCFLRCYTLKSVTIHEGVTAIGDSAFSECTSLESVTIPDTIKFIEKNAFHDCKSLKSIKIPDSIRRVGADAFKGCISIESVKFNPEKFKKSNFKDVWLFPDCMKLQANGQCRRCSGEIRHRMILNDICTVCGQVTYR